MSIETVDWQEFRNRVSHQNGDHMPDELGSQDGCSLCVAGK